MTYDRRAEDKRKLNAAMQAALAVPQNRRVLAELDKQAGEEAILARAAKKAKIKEQIARVRSITRTVMTAVMDERDFKKAFQQMPDLTDYLEELKKYSKDEIEAAGEGEFW